MRSMKPGFKHPGLSSLGKLLEKTEILRFAQNDIFEKASRLNQVNYEVFARKYRPQTFDDLVGQIHVSRTLKNAVAQNRLAHAYLFVGPRGVGKTSTARILAKGLE